MKLGDKVNVRTNSEKFGLLIGTGIVEGTTHDSILVKFEESGLWVWVPRKDVSSL